MAATRVAVRGLTKVFTRISAMRSRGISTEGAKALKYMLQQAMTSRRHREEPTRGDARYLWALDDVSFDVDGGEVLGIIGRNGAGKSTLLKILARVMQPTSGRATVHGRVVSMLELGLAAAPKSSARKNIEIQGRLAGLPAQEIARAEDAILELAGLTEFADTPLQSCPSGSPVQLSFAAMLTFGAEVVLADEVLAVGDSEFRALCETRVREAGESGESVLFVSHDMAAIKRICTRVIWIDRGRIVMDGPTDEVVDAYTTELLAGRLAPEPSAGAKDTGCTLLELRLLDGNRAQVGALQLTEPGRIDCLFRATAGTSVVVELTLISKKQVVCSARSAPVTAGATTTYSVGIVVPADFLNEQSYVVRAKLHARRLLDAAGEYSVAGEEQLEFSVMNPHPERSVWKDWPWGRGGLISPRLAWSTAPADPKGSVE